MKLIWFVVPMRRHMGIPRSKNICTAVYEDVHGRIRKHAVLRLQLARYS